MRESEPLEHCGVTEWMVRLKGHGFDLAELAQLFKHPDALVIRDGDDYHLKSVEFDAEIEAVGVYEKAKVLLDRLNDLATVRAPGYRAVEVDVVVELMPDGSRRIAAFLSGRSELRSRVAGNLTALRADGSPADSEQDDPVVAMKRAAVQHPAVADAIHFFRVGDWVSLYKVYEIVKDDVGGDHALARHAWLSKARLKRFTQTAQSRDALGDAARHASRSHRPPPDPMSPEAAKALVRELVTKWLTTK